MRKKKPSRKDVSRAEISGLIKEAESLRTKAAEIIRRMKDLSIEIDKNPSKPRR